MIVENFDKREIIENIPLSLSYEISKEKVDTELKEKVLSGEIRDRKTFIEKAKEKTPVKNIATEKIEKPQDYFIEPIKNYIKYIIPLRKHYFLCAVLDIKQT